MAEEGADIVVNYRSNREAAEDTAAAVREAGCRALVHQADVSDREAVAGLYTAAVEQFGRIDIAVANAAFSIREPIVGACWENVMKVLSVAQFGAFHTCQMAAQQMLKQAMTLGCRGKILIISSVREMVPFENSGAYNMAKAGINHFGRTLATEMARARINVNIINPGWIDTPGERKYHTDEQLREAGAKLPWGRMGEPEDIGKAAVFLCSDAADYITGTMLLVDGGLLLSAGLDNSCAENE
jgi:glucose 1-dehydrogenase